MLGDAWKILRGFFGDSLRFNPQVALRSPETRWRRMADPPLPGAWMGCSGCAEILEDSLHRYNSEVDV